MPGYSLPYLEAEALIAAMRVFNEQDQSRPMLQLFQRQAAPADLIKIRRLTRKAGQVRHTSVGGRAMPVERGELKEDYYSPSYIKLKDHITMEDMKLFAAAASAQGANDVGPLAKSRITAANERIREIALNLAEDIAEERHRLCCEAMLGQVTYTVGDGGSQTVDYGLTAITSPGTDWDNAGATIVSDLYGFINEFRNANAKGLAPDTVFYGEDLYADCFVGNTEWNTFKKENPEYAIGFLRVAGGRNEADTNGTFVDRVFGLNWVKVEGSYRDLNGAIQKRWPSNKLAFARIGGTNGARPTWMMTLDEWQNPRPETNIEIGLPVQGSDVKTPHIVAFDNGVPAFYDPELVMPVEVYSA
jgi:hypothetical protein